MGGDGSMCVGGHSQRGKERQQGRDAHANRHTGGVAPASSNAGKVRGIVSLMAMMGPRGWRFCLIGIAVGGGGNKMMMDHHCTGGCDVCGDSGSKGKHLWFDKFLCH